MKNIIIILALTVSGLLLSGCGQDLDVTVYNATGITSASGWVAIDANTNDSAQWIEPTGTALSDINCDATNSFTYKAKENATLNIGGNGQYATVDSLGAVTMHSFTLPNGTQILYGDLLSTPHWYAAVNMQSVIFYKK